MRIKCIVSYDGTLFYGWQRQSNDRSVQEEIEIAIERLTKESVKIYSSGRTDAHVHAYGQVFHFDTTKELEIKRWLEGLNHFLPEDIHILSVEKVSEEFHSRYSCIEKEYVYKLSTNDYNPFERHYIYQYPYGSLDLEAMRDASTLFVGTHDYASFCTFNGLGDTIRTISSIKIEEKDGYFTFSLRGNGFRRYMVRHIVGGLIQVGAHRRDKAFLKELLDSKGEKKCLFKAEPQGLYLSKVYYDYIDN